MAHFILDVVEQLDLRQVRVNERGTGREPDRPPMLLALLLYGYATGGFSSRRMAQATLDSVPGRMICGATHPDHDTIGTFGRENKAGVQERFVRGLDLAQALEFLPGGQISVAVDGTQVLANASKHAAVSYGHAGKPIQQLELAVKGLLAKAEPAASTPLAAGRTIPQEGPRRQARQAELAAARAEMAARAKARAAAAMAASQAKLAAREAPTDRGEKPRGPEPKAPSPQPKPSEPYHFTDPPRRIMKAGNGQHFEQSYPAQAVVAGERRWIVGQRVSPAPNDKPAWVPPPSPLSRRWRRWPRG